MDINRRIENELDSVAVVHVVNVDDVARD